MAITSVLCPVECIRFAVDVLDIVSMQLLNSKEAGAHARLRQLITESDRLRSLLIAAADETGVRERH